ncbi:MAG: ParA family protein [Rhodospirillales bacterium]|nr:ParA family protein [Rhodospirillales bacterium]
MISVLVANMKGGAGKTTIATNLAAAFACNGLSTALADGDRQGSSLRWGKARPSSAAPVALLDWTRALEQAPRGTARLVIDSPAAMRATRIEELVARADVIVVPVVPSVFDQDTTAKFLGKLTAIKPVRKGKRPFALVQNRVRKRSRATEQLEAFISSLECHAVGRVPDRAIYPELAAEGRGVFDVTGARGAPLRSDWLEILDFIEESA